VITTGKAWMASLVSWIPGLKHPETPRTEYMNCHDLDRLRRVLIARCSICDYVVSRDEKAVRELIFTCKDTTCQCQKTGAASHQVCNLCYDLFHALYANYLMKNRNYFREMDDRDRKDYDPDKRRRMGL